MAVPILLVIIQVKYEFELGWRGGGDLSGTTQVEGCYQAMPRWRDAVKRHQTLFKQSLLEQFSS